MIDKLHPKAATIRKSIADWLREMRAINPEVARIMWRSARRTQRITEEILACVSPAPVVLTAMAYLYGIDQEQITASTDYELRAEILGRMMP